jgi:hypothetical protein
MKVPGEKGRKVKVGGAAYKKGVKKGMSAAKNPLVPSPSRATPGRRRRASA